MTERGPLTDPIFLELDIVPDLVELVDDVDEPIDEAAFRLLLDSGLA